MAYVLAFLLGGIAALVGFWLWFRSLPKPVRRAVQHVAGIDPVHADWMMRRAEGGKPRVPPRPASFD